MQHAILHSCYALPYASPYASGYAYRLCVGLCVGVTPASSSEPGARGGDICPVNSPRPGPLGSIYVLTSVYIYDLL